MNTDNICDVCETEKTRLSFNGMNLCGNCICKGILQGNPDIKLNELIRGFRQTITYHYARMHNLDEYDINEAF